MLAILSYLAEGHVVNPIFYVFFKYDSSVESSNSGEDNNTSEEFLHRSQI